MPAGFALAYLLDRIDGPRPMLLFCKIGVAEAWQRRGVGRLLVEQLKQVARDTRVLKMWVETNRADAAAAALHRATGGIERASTDDVSFEYRFDLE